ncbi:MAG TPA: helix-turn-helix transcriptional regulator [Woeseiaceae bacterium]|nr:helix-turn-helix transcriptional regulator [Woeseiaceae bacterium]
MSRSDALRLDRFGENLRVLCSYVRSVSHVCRQLGINRQQFARYLNGETLPSQYNLRKICDHFGVEESEIFLPVQEFRQLISPQAATQRKTPEKILGALDLPLADSTAAARYVGYYYRYLRSVEYPGRIIKAAVRVFLERDRVRTKAIERLKPEQAEHRRFETYKYAGVLVLLADRIFMVELDVLLKNAITETILYPSHKHPMTLLYGEAFGISSGVARQPYMTPMVYEFVGTQVNLRQFLSRCGLFDQDSTAIDDEIRRYVLKRQPA